MHGFFQSSRVVFTLGPAIIMLRVAARQTTSRCPKLFGLKLVTGAAAAGTIGYAYNDPEFRKIVQSYVPQAKELFKSIIGSAE
jgi:hypothetical protein